VTVSILTLVAISLDRFYVVKYPLKPKLRKKTCFLIIFFIWVIAFILSSYNLYNYHVEIDEQNVPRCNYIEERFLKIQLIFLTTFQFLLPLMIISFTVVSIYHRIYKKDEPFFNMTSSNQIQIKNRKKVLLNNPYQK